MVTKKVNQFYMKYAIEHLVLAMDDHSLFCMVISETVEGISYRVEMDEETMVAKSCSCPARGECKHLEIANSLQFANSLQYKVAPAAEPVVEEPTITEVERKSWYIVNHTHQVWNQDGVWMCAEGAEFVEMVKAHLGIQVEPKVIPIKRDVLDAPLNGNRGFSVLKQEVA